MAELHGHPYYKDLHRYFAADPIKTRIAFSTYLDLTEAKNWHNVRIHHRDDLEYTYFSGQQTLDAQPEIVFPFSVHSIPTINGLHMLFDVLDDPSGRSPHPRSIVVCVTASDSTSTSYRLSKGLVPPSAALVGLETEGGVNDDEDGPQRLE